MRLLTYMVCERRRYLLLLQRHLTYSFRCVSTEQPNEIIHRDLKPENLIFLNRNPDSPLVLVDFGIAKALGSSEELTSTTCGSPGYTGRFDKGRAEVSVWCVVCGLNVGSLLQHLRFYEEFPTEKPLIFIAAALFAIPYCVDVRLSPHWLFLKG